MVSSSLFLVEAKATKSPLPRVRCIIPRAANLDQIQIMLLKYKAYKGKLSYTVYDRKYQYH